MPSEITAFGFVQGIVDPMNHIVTDRLSFRRARPGPAGLACAKRLNAAGRRAAETILADHRTLSCMSRGSAGNEHPDRAIREATV